MQDHVIFHHVSHCNSKKKDRLSYHYPCMICCLHLMCRPLIATTCIHQSIQYQQRASTNKKHIYIHGNFLGAAMLPECGGMNPFPAFVSSKRTHWMGCRKSLRKAVDLFSLDLVSIAARQMKGDMDAGSGVVVPPSMEVFRSRDLDLFQLDPSGSQQRNPFKIAHGVISILLMEEIRLTSWEVGYPIIYRVLKTSQVVVWDFFHQQYFSFLDKIWCPFKVKALSIFPKRVFVWGNWQLDSHGFDSQSRMVSCIFGWKKKYAANLEILGSNPAKMLGTFFQMILAWDSRYRISHNLPQKPLMIPNV